MFSLDDLEHHDHEKGIREAGKLEAKEKPTWWPMATSSTSSSMSEDPGVRHPMHPL